MTQEMHTMSCEIPKRKLSLQEGISKPVNWLSHSIPVLFLILTLVFSTNGFAVVCVNAVTLSESNKKTYLAEAPNDPVRYYMVGLSSYCTGKEAEGINYMEKASDMEHIMASYALGRYYRTDRGTKPSQTQIVPEVQENYNAAIFYYERTASYIEATANYPYNTHRDIPEMEGQLYMSIRTYLILDELYYNGYGRALGDMLSNDVSYTDTIKVLVNMQSAAERCLNRPSLAAWKGRQSEIAHSKQVMCGAYKTFADRAFNLESQRIEIAKRCEGSLSECTEHQIIVQKIVQASQEMTDTINSVPTI